MTARRAIPALQGSHGLWHQTAQPAPKTSSLSGELKSDVVIIGAGYTGLSAALRLAERGTRVIVLEASEIGFGGSGRNSGLVNAGMWVRPEHITAVLGVRGERLLSVLGDAPKCVFELVEAHKIPCDAVQNGTLHCAVGRRGLADILARCEQWRRLGAPVRFLDAAETAQRVGTSYYSGSILDERCGTIQPLAYVRGLAQAAIDAGAKVFTRSRVQRIQHSAGASLAQTSNGSVLAEWMIIATEAYTDDLSPDIRSEIVRFPYFNVSTTPLDDDVRVSILPGGEGLIDTKRLIRSLRLDRGGRLVFGSVGALGGIGYRAHLEWSKRALGDLFPTLRRVHLECAWHGHIAMTRDHLPKFHTLAPNAVCVTGYNGRGIAPGTIFGRILADYVSGTIGDEDLPILATSPARYRLRGLRENFYDAGSKLAHFVGARL